jgi:hypothetical protein
MQELILHSQKFVELELCWEQILLVSVFVVLLCRSCLLLRLLKQEFHLWQQEFVEVDLLSEPEEEGRGRRGVRT